MAEGELDWKGRGVTRREGREKSDRVRVRKEEKNRGRREGGRETTVRE